VNEVSTSKSYKGRAVAPIDGDERRKALLVNEYEPVQCPFESIHLWTLNYSSAVAACNQTKAQAERIKTNST
jgi:hypothetical protein